MQVIELAIHNICSAASKGQTSDQTLGLSSENNPDDHSASVYPADAALLLPHYQHSAGSASSAEWTTVSHGQLAAYASLVTSLELGQQDVVLTQTSPAEPLGVYQLLLSLFAGAAMLPARATSAHEMVSAMAKQNVTVCLATVDELQDWLHAGLSSQVQLPPPFCSCKIVTATFLKEVSCPDI